MGIFMAKFSMSYQKCRCVVLSQKSWEIEILVAERVTKWQNGLRPFHVLRTFHVSMGCARFYAALFIWLRRLWFSKFQCLRRFMCCACFYG